MALLSPVAPMASRNRRSAARLLTGAILCGLALVATSTLAGAASSRASAAKISAHLTKKSFTSAQASSVKLVYTFSAPSRHFRYLLTIKKPHSWQAVKSVRKHGHFRGTRITTVKKIFAGKPVRVGRYRLKLSDDKSGKILNFKVVKARPPVNTARPTISGATTLGQTLSASNGSWNNSPTSYALQWRRCDTSGASCSDVSGASSSSYVLQAADIGSTIRVVVKATNADGSASATSDQTAVVTSFATAIGAGAKHTCAVLSGGTVKCWGYNSYGQLGNGTTTSSRTPVQVSGITNANAISAGDGHTCALLSDHTVKCWGNNSVGQLGNGTTTLHPTPVQVSGITTATAISAGGNVSCALLSNGTIKCWGYNSYGQLGNGTTTSSLTPVQVADITTATAISAGVSHTCAVLSGGTIKCWGYNSNGQLGNSTTTSSQTPVQVVNITTATAISVGSYHSCAVLSDGTAKCWGYNNYGQLGNHSKTSVSIPVSVVGVGGSGILSGVTAISAENYDSCALLSSGETDCWGWNEYGQLGNGTTSDSSVRVQASGITNASAISVGNGHTCALLSDGTAKCWGHNSDGQLGDSTTTNRTTPVSVVGLP